MTWTRPDDAAAPFGWRLLGSGDEAGRKLAVRTELLLSAVILFSNIGGVIVISLLAIFAVPGFAVFDASTRAVANVIAVPAYVAFAAAVGTAWGKWRLRPRLAWVAAGEVPDAAGRAAALDAPLELLAVQSALWTIGLTLVAGVNAWFDLSVMLRGLVLGLIGGALTVSFSYLLSEVVMRPVAALAMRNAAAVDVVAVRSLKARALFVAGVSALPVVGLMAAAIFAWAESTSGAPTNAWGGVASLAKVVLVIGTVAIVATLALAAVAARATLDPVRSLQAGLRRLDRGELDVVVPVYDGSELGRLQAGFNMMVAGLREREQIRELFGRHVGEDVARVALEHGAGLGGTIREVAVVFVDIVGSTRLAATLPPDEVVAILNRFFSVVVDVVAEFGGFVNKFSGDAALALFGAPDDLDDPAGHALAAARALRARLAERMPDLDAGIGVAAGKVLAGNVGDESRFEYTVIGDPVNEAARLCELAKHRDARVVASMSAVDAAERAESAYWRPGDEVVLRGRIEPTRLATPGLATESA